MIAKSPKFMTQTAQRTDSRRLQDLTCHLEILINAHKELIKHNFSFYKSLLQNLRPLICDDIKRKNRALLLYFIEKYNLNAQVTISGHGPAVSLSLQDYLSQKMMVDSKEMTLCEFIFDFASQDAAHSDKEMTEFIASGESLILGGIPANIREAMNTAKIVINVGLSVLKSLNTVTVR